MGLVLLGYAADMRMLPALLALDGLLVLACCFPSEESQERWEAKQAARAANEAARQERVPADRAHLVAIAEKAAAIGELPATACDSARLDGLRAGPPDGVSDTFWDMAWLAELGWLQAAAAQGPSKTPPPWPTFEDHVSLEVKVAFKQKSSSSEGAAKRDLDNWGELMERKPPLLAIIHEQRVQQPVLTFGGVGPVDGSFHSGAYVADLSLWDLRAEELLCGTRVEAVSSATVDLGGLFAENAQSELEEDFEEQVGEALNAAASSLSPGLRVVL